MRMERIIKVRRTQPVRTKGAPVDKAEFKIISKAMRRQEMQRDLGTGFK